MSLIQALNKRRDNLLSEILSIDAEIFADKVMDDIRWERSGVIVYDGMKTPSIATVKLAADMLSKEGITYELYDKMVEYTMGGFYDGDHTSTMREIRHTFKQKRD